MQNDDIKQILEQIKREYNVASDDPFQSDAKRSVSSIVFEQVSGFEPEEEDADFVIPDDVFRAISDIDISKLDRKQQADEENAEAEAVADASVALEAEDDTEREEFFIPEQKEEKKNEFDGLDETMHSIWTTYVPVFTGISDNYRMRGQKSKSAPKVIKTEEPKKAEMSAPEDYSSEDVETVNTDAVIINVGKDTEEPKQKSEVLNVFKFSEDKADVKKERERTLEDELADIDALMGKKSEMPEIPEIPEITENVDEQSEESKSEELSAEEAYILDYPFDDSKALTPTARVYLPEGAETRADENKKNSEFTNQSQKDKIKDKFLDIIMSVKVRFIALALLSLVLLVFENLYVFGIKIDQMIFGMPNPAYMALIDLMFVISMLVLTLPEIITKLGNIFKKNVVSEIFTLFMALTLILYCISIVTFTPTKYTLLGFAFAIMALVTVGGAYYENTAHFISFKVVSMDGEKRVFDRKLTRMLENENMALDGLVDEYSSHTARFYKTGFISDFFKQSREMKENSFGILLCLVVSFAIAFISAIITYFLSGSFAAVAAFTFVMVFAIPAFYVLSHKLSLYHSEKEALSENSTAVGEGAFYDYSSVDVIAFRDTEIFGEEDVSIKRIMMFADQGELSGVMEKMAALFHICKGPLEPIFNASLNSAPKKVTDPVLESDGISGIIDGTRIFAGSKEYMQRHGIHIPGGDLSKNQTGYDSTRIMYVARDGGVYAKFFLRYTFSEEFTMLLPILKKERIVPLIYTKDPNISNELLKILNSSQDLMRVMKETIDADNTEKQTFANISSGLVTLGDKINAINMLLLSRKYVRFTKSAATTVFISSIVGAVLASVLVFGGMSLLPSMLIGGWQSIWCAVLYIISQNNFKDPKVK